MMKQRENIAPLPVVNPSEGLSKLISNQDRVDELLNQGKSAIILLKGKKELLSKVWTMHEQIVKKAKLFDEKNCTDLHVQIKNKLPKSSNKISKGQNEKLA